MPAPETPVPTKENPIVLKSKRVTHFVYYDDRGILCVQAVRHEKSGDVVEPPLCAGPALNARLAAKLIYLARKFSRPELARIPLFRW